MSHLTPRQLAEHHASLALFGTVCNGKVRDRIADAIQTAVSELTQKQAERLAVVETLAAELAGALKWAEAELQTEITKRRVAAALAEARGMGL